MKLTRRTVLSRASIVAGGVIASPAILHWPAYAAEFAYKCGTALPDGHPMVIRGREAAAKIKEESGGRLDITFYTEQRPRPGHRDDLADHRRRAGNVLPADRPARPEERRPAAIFGVGFAFDGYDPCLGSDGRRSRQLSARIAKGIGFHCIDKAPDHGFRQITMKSKPINTPDDLKGVKIRLPVAPYLIALFKALGASPTPINFGEVYSALQTGLVDGQENPLILIDTAKLYEVQKYCSMTNHVWACIHYSFSNPYWNKLPNDLKDAVGQALQRRGDDRARRLAEDDEPTRPRI